MCSHRASEYKHNYLFYIVYVSHRASEYKHNYLFYIV